MKNTNRDYPSIVLHKPRIHVYIPITIIRLAVQLILGLQQMKYAKHGFIDNPWITQDWED